MKAVIKIPDKITAVLSGKTLTIEGPNGKVTRSFNTTQAELSLDNKEFTIKSIGESREFKRIVNSIEAHVYNMINGVQKSYVYKLKACYQHFPINLKVVGDKLSIENFFGEKKPRFAKLLPNVKVTVDGANVTVSSPDRESAGQTAANIEQATRIVKRDKRVFQDGIWIISKGDSNEV